ncbi:MAG: hypothetical protein JSS86_14350 [Cyanobacteria bacterium SZAS LIN-2]|nr:hypothetical protein [Cyanobacteria bacterium SZAS LIN-2]
MNSGPYEFSPEPVKGKDGLDGRTQLANFPNSPVDFGAYRLPQPVDLAKAADMITGGKPAVGNETEVAVRPQPLTGYSTSDRWRAEGSLLASLPSHIGPGIMESVRDAWANKGRTAFETVSGLALGSVFCLLSKNPRPIISAATTWAGRAFLGIAALDMGGRFARPMSDTWAHPENLELDKKVLGHNIGDAVVNYGLAVGGGIAGARLGENYLATTKLGTILQGYKETEVSAEALGKILAEPATAGEPLGVMARAFERTTGTAGTPELPINGPMRMREMPDGSHIGSTKDGNVMVLTRDGTALWFKNNRSAFGFRDKLELAKVLHQGGDETDILTGMFSPTTSGSFGAHGAASKSPFIGKDPASYFEAPGASADAAQAAAKTGTYTTVDGTKFLTGQDGVLSSVETGGNRVFLDQKGKWHLGMAEAPPSSSPSPARAFDFLHLDLSPATFNLGGLTDRFRDLKKGAEVGLTESVLARMGDIGSGVLEHEVLIRTTGSHGGAGAAESDNAAKPSI